MFNEMQNVIDDFATKTKAIEKKFADIQAELDFNYNRGGSIYNQMYNKASSEYNDSIFLSNKYIGNLGDNLSNFSVNL